MFCYGYYKTGFKRHKKAQGIESEEQALTSKVLYFMDTQNNQIFIRLIFLVVQNLINSTEKNTARSLIQMPWLPHKV